MTGIEALISIVEHLSDTEVTRRVISSARNELQQFKDRIKELELDAHYNNMTFEGEIEGDVNPDFLSDVEDELHPDDYMNGSTYEGDEDAAKFGAN
jgi:hypothetical protein